MKKYPTVIEAIGIHIGQVVFDVAQLGAGHGVEGGLVEGRLGDKAGSIVEVAAAFQWTTAYTETVTSFVNNIHTIDGGTHVSGLRAALTRMVNNYAQREKLGFPGVNDAAKRAALGLPALDARDAA